MSRIPLRISASYNEPVSITAEIIGSPDGTNIKLNYSYDNNTWQTFIDAPSGNAITINLNAGEEVYFETPSMYSTINNGSRQLHFIINGKCKLDGSLAYMTGNYEGSYIHDDNVIWGDYCFANMFKNCTSIKELAVDCEGIVIRYSFGIKTSAYAFLSTFEGCTGINKTSNCSLASNYNSPGIFKRTFYGCSSMKEMPLGMTVGMPDFSNYLPVETYESTFEGCTKLVSAYNITSGPEYAFSGDVTYGARCYKRTFYGCSKLLLFKNPTVTTGLTLILHYTPDELFEPPTIVLEDEALLDTFIGCKLEGGGYNTEQVHISNDYAYIKIPPEPEIQPIYLENKEVVEIYLDNKQITSIYSKKKQVYEYKEG